MPKPIPKILAGLQADTKDRQLTLYIYDDIGPAWAGMIDAGSVAAALRDAGDVDTIVVRINSPGGGVFEAAAIYNQLREHAAEIHVKIDGVAASAASVIAMAGDKIEIAGNAMIMIHQASTIAWGNSAELTKTAEMLDKVDTTIVDTYAARTGRDAQEIRDWMASETWFGADDAVANGFADSKVGAVKNAKIQIPKDRYKHPPENLKQYEPAAPAIVLTRPAERPESQPVRPTAALAARIAVTKARLNLA